MTDPEIWVDVRGFEGIYEVSNKAQVRSKTTGRPISQSIDPIGRRAVHLRKSGETHNRRVHRLVCEAFNGAAPDGKTLALHRNGDVSDNRPENLYWGDHSDNRKDSVLHGTHPAASKTHCKWGHPLEGLNNVPSSSNRGRRSCRACSQERANAYRTGRPFDPKKADVKFQGLVVGDMRDRYSRKKRDLNA